MKIKLRLIVSFLIIYVITIAIASAFYYHVSRDTITTQIFNQLESVIVNKEKRIESVIAKNLERLSLVSSRTQLRLSLRNYLLDDTVTDLQKIDKIINDALASIGSFEEISIISLSGNVVISTNRALSGTVLSHTDYLLKGLKNNSVDSYFLDDAENLKVYLSGPLYLKGQTLGVIAIKADADDLLTIVKDYSGMGETGESLIARRDLHGDALFLTPLRFEEGAALRKTVKKADLEKPIIQALNRNESLFEDSIDYRGKKVLAATRFIDSIQWGLVAKIDNDEAFRPITELRDILLFIIFISSIIIIIVSLYLERTITGPIKRLTDFAGDISRGNLSQRIDLRNGDEIGTLAHTFNEMTDNLDISNKKLEEQIREQKKISSQLEQELHERSLMQEQLLLLQTSVDNAAESIFLIDRNAKFIEINKEAYLSLGYSKEELLTMNVSDIDPNFPFEKWEKHWDNIQQQGTMSFESVHRRKNGSDFPVDVRVNYITYAGKEYNFAFAKDISDRKLAEDKIRESLKEKELLLRELHHRTKNNMQVISSLLDLQAETIDVKDYQGIFFESRNRIKSMALIHEKLYRSSDIANVDIEDYIQTLGDKLIKTYGISSDRVVLTTDIQNITLGIDMAIPCGLIINELISNALKYAFPGERSGIITVSFIQSMEDEYVLKVSDNGIGMPPEVDLDTVKSLGLQLVTTLARHQLRGSVEFTKEQGTQFTISFREIKYRKRT